MKSTIHYVNTDLELVAAVDLAPLADALASRGLFQLNLHVYRGAKGLRARRELASIDLFQLDLYQHAALWHATFETDESFDSPEPNIEAFLAVIETLDSAARNLWNACVSCIFDVGFECGDEPFGFRSHVTTPTLARVVALGASLHLTIYPSSGVQAHHNDSKTPAS